MKIIIFLFISINIFAKDVILLLGSLNSPNAKYMNKIVKALSKEGREIIDDIGVDPFDHTITEQADKVYNELIRRGITKNDRLIIIGHSQGGLRGYELYRKYKDNLNMLALFTVSTPWRGASILEKIKDTYKKLEGVHTICSKIGEHYNTLRTEMCKEMNLSSEQLKNLLALFPSFDKSLKNLENSPGAKDLKVDSDFIKKLNQENNLSNLNNDNVTSNIITKTTLPIFNIIGHKVNLDNYLSDKELVKTKDKIYKKIDEGKQKANSVALGSMITGPALTLAAASFLGPFALLFHGVALGIAAKAEFSADNKTAEAYKLIRDLNYLIDFIDYIKKLASNNKDDHDLVLSVHEQSLPCYLEKLQESIPFLKPYSERKIFIDGGVHGEITIEGINIEKLNSLNSKAIYNQDKTIKFIKENIDIILNKEEKCQKYY